MKTLSNQSEILRLISDGWELGSSSAGSTHQWLQKGGLCNGGDMVNVHASSLRSLLRKNLICRNPKPERRFWLTRYIIADKEN